MENELEIMELITCGGEARSKALMAMNKIAEYDFDGAEALLKESGKLILQAHKTQTSLLTKEACNGVENTPLLMVHAQDHLMDASVIKDLVESILVMQKNNYQRFINNEHNRTPNHRH